MTDFAPPIARLIDELMKLPTIGPKSAARLAFHIISGGAEDARRLAAALIDVKERIRPCTVCFNLTEAEVCPICTDPRRDRSLVCVVSDARDVLAIERAREFHGLFHVLGGVISPMDGIGPEHLNIAPLLQRVAAGGIQEIILATDPTVGGETTALYLSRLLQAHEVSVTRLAYGLPHGMTLEYADEVTLARSLQGRRAVGPGS